MAYTSCCLGQLIAHFAKYLSKRKMFRDKICNEKLKMHFAHRTVFFKVSYFRIFLKTVAERDEVNTCIDPLAMEMDI